MIEIDIPGRGTFKLEYAVLDFNGTISKDGELLPGVKGKLGLLSKKLKVYVLTSDTYGTAKKSLIGTNCVVRVLNGDDAGLQKAKFVIELGVERTVCMGNGNNDRKMLMVAKLGIAVVGPEGASTAALRAADVNVNNILDGFDLLLKPKRLKATLRL